MQSTSRPDDSSSLTSVAHKSGTHVSVVNIQGSAEAQPACKVWVGGWCVVDAAHLRALLGLAESWLAGSLRLLPASSRQCRLLDGHPFTSVVVNVGNSRCSCCSPGRDSCMWWAWTSAVVLLQVTVAPACC
jgi:hypothetical protein